MFRQRLIPLFLTGIALLLISCALDRSAPTSEKLNSMQFTVLHTNDNHGKFWRNRRGEMGMAARKTLIDRIRSEVENEGGKVLVLSAGDVNTGVPESDLQQAKPDFIGMNMIGYDAMVLGNHEFDNPLDVLLEQERWADFPFLAANIFYKNDDKLLFKPYIMKNLEGVRVAILGLTTEDTEAQVMPDNVKDIYFTDAVTTAKSWVPKLKHEEKADVVIALTHIGHYLNAQYGSNAPGDVTLAKDVDGIDIIVGGHSQNKMEKPDIKNSTYILQAWEWGKYVGRADFEYYYVDNFDGKGNRGGVLKMINYRLIPVNLKKQVLVDGKSEWVNIEPQIPEDPDVLKVLQVYQDKASKLLLKKVGSLDKAMSGARGIVRSRPAAIGVLIARAQMEKTKADLGVINGGGIRTGLPAGNITEKDILSVQPFGNLVCFVEMNGSELRNFVEAIASIEPGNGGFAHFTDNVRLTISGGEKLTRLEINGKPVQKDKTYRLSINEFSASGGDKWPEIDNNPTFINTGYTDALVLKEYIQKHSPLKQMNFEPKAGDIVRK
ncbi:bifunctional UDP-sugar hydrolase/5'-nucleotidase UshA [Endozoicomonas gorgoniicola]|uniref:Bifunctional UDP-sugar hydrolase/5'-nucleotidase UshA n=1 Tax=Endozoicomonas gorgoniicola TaxID=1234144 RepID=A0ABT3N0M7_9GAMM|nr:bifunctional UDP-sugar hydrolase/5'-nucleotidase UshA [Endozoicomonas gorgoniicola]MCW7555188.1 bifunctional UDP-sugar hydrolase/5'-nucleotidase UshA [Endozoicomonas gorgoniicola]